jgi:pyruvate carboxylase
MIDCCIDSFSGLTSQPAMGSIVNSLRGWVQCLLLT